MDDNQRKRIGCAVGFGLAATLVVADLAAAAGFREQQSWQFRSPAETQTNLNREALRLQLQQQGTVLRSPGGGGTSIPLSGGALGLGSSNATIGNQTNTTTSVTITVNGDNNAATVDGYLNLNADQVNEGQTSKTGTGGVK